MIVNNNFFSLDRLDMYILYITLAELPKAPRGGGANARFPPLLAALLLR